MATKGREESTGNFFLMYLTVSYMYLVHSGHSHPPAPSYTPPINQAHQMPILLACLFVYVL